MRKTFSHTGARKNFVKDNFTRATSKNSTHASAIPSEIHKHSGFEQTISLLSAAQSDAKLSTYNTIFAKTSSVDLFEQQKANILSSKTSPKNVKGGKVV